MGTKKHMQQRVQPPCSARGSSFFKVMLGDFKRSLRVPPSFTRHIVGKAQCRFNLQSIITGRTWHVEVERVGDNLFFSNGWEQFAKDHMILMGDFLVFNYDGNVGFTIHVYGSDGCEKKIFASDNNDSLFPTGAAKMAVHPDEPLCQGKIPPTIVRSDKVLEEAFSFEAENPSFVAAWRQSRAYHMTVPSTLVKKFDFRRKMHTMLHDYLGRFWPIQVRVCEDGRVNFANGWSKFSRGNNLTDGDACVFEFIREGEIIQAHIFQLEKGTGKVIKRCAEPICRGRRPSTVVGSEKALEESLSFKPESPYLVARWRWSRVSYMTVPRSFVSKHNLGSHESVSLLDPCGRTWPVKICCRKDGRVGLGTGMGVFFRGNNVRDGDVCSFDFAVGGGAVKVHIGRCPRS